MHTGRLAGGLAASLFLGSLVAFGAPSIARADDSPSPNVARLSLSQGSVAVQRSGATASVAGSVNTPLSSGDALTTGGGARAEVQFDGTSVLRMDQNAQVRFANLDPSNRTIQLAQGTVSLDQFHGSQDQTEIDTPSASVRVASDGRYRVTVDQSGATYISTRSGSADVLLPQGTQQVAAGTTLLVTGTAARPTFSIVGTVAVDSFDLFNEQRDDALIAALGNDDNVPTQVAAGDLNEYGSWTDDPAYGQVWVPNSNQTAGWAPYRDGNWTWEASFGWTWVGSEPWGWAPYHYGRWFYDRHDGGWCWYPSARNVGWAPALVGFVSFGGGFNLSLGFGGLGWVPLGPNEAYHPWYGYERGRGWHTTVDYKIVNNNYYNLVRGGGSSVDGRRYALGQGHNRAFTAQQTRDAVVYRGTTPLNAGAHDYAFGGRVVPSSQRQIQAWGRFNTARGSVGTRVGNDTRTSQYARPSGQRNDQRFAQGRAQSQNQGDPWARFNSTRGNYVPRSTDNGNRQYSNGGDRQYSNGGDRQYSNGGNRQYSSGGNRQNSNGGDRRYSNGGDRQYSAPQQPQRQYSAPQQPQRQYSAPQQPQRQYSAPQRSSGSSDRHDSGNSGSRSSGSNESSHSSNDSGHSSNDSHDHSHN